MSSLLRTLALPAGFDNVGNSNLLQPPLSSDLCWRRGGVLWGCCPRRFAEILEGDPIGGPMCHVAPLHKPQTPIWGGTPDIDPNRPQIVGSPYTRKPQQGSPVILTPIAKAPFRARASPRMKPSAPTSNVKAPRGGFRV